MSFSLKEIFDQFSKELNKKAQRIVHESILTRVLALGDGFLLILTNYGCHHHVLLTNFLNWYCKYFVGITSEDVFNRKAKFLCCWPMAKYLRNEHKGYRHLELPVGSEPRLCGPFGKWFRSRLVAYNKDNTALFYSWYHAKRCAEPLSDACVWSEFEKHKEILSSDDPYSFLRSSELDSELAYIDDEIWALRRSLSSISQMDDFLPSRSASLEASRDDGGQRSVISSLYGGLAEEDLFAGILHDRDSFIVSMSTYELLKMDYRPYVLLDHKIRYNACFELRRPSTHFHNPSSCWKITAASFSSDLILSARIEAVLEPLKCRIISKGPAVDYFACKRIQDCLHSALRKMPIFRLVGQPVTGDMLLDLEHDRGDYYVSGDYSAATDKCSGILGLAILRAIMGERLVGSKSGKIRFDPPPLGHRMASVADSVFGFHHLNYGRRDPETGVFREMDAIQSRGQLMGSILSFIILCLLNLIVYRKTAQICDLPPDAVLINGDDILFRAPFYAYETYKEIASEVGFEYSVGKCYLHPSYANLNSTCFHRSLNSGSGRVCVSEVPYLNASLVFGKHKVQVDESRGESLPSVSHWNQVVRSVRPDRGRQLWCLFCRYNSEALDILCRGGKEPFLPCALGGLGLVHPIAPRRIDHKVKYKLGRPRLKVAGLLRALGCKETMREQHLRLTQRPVIGNENIERVIRTGPLLEKERDDLHRYFDEEENVVVWRQTMTRLKAGKISALDLAGTVIVYA